MRDFARMILVLFVACGLAAASLGVVNIVTRERIAQWDKQRQENALRSLFAQADEFKELTPGKVWEIRSKGQKVGVACLSEIQGYSGVISLIFGVDANGAVTGLQVLNHTETPGLGAKITSAGFRNQFRNKRLEDLKLRKDAPDTGQIDAITGATISSRAVTKAVYTTMESLNMRKEGDGK